MKKHWLVKTPKYPLDNDKKLISGNGYWFSAILDLERNRTSVYVYATLFPDDGFKWVSIENKQGTHVANIPMEWLVPGEPTCPKCNQLMVLTP